MNKLSCNVKAHGRTRLEIKLHYPLFLSGKKTSRYKISSVFFIPKSLEVDSQHYSEKDLLNSLSTNIRFSTPRLDLSDLLNKKLEESPINRLLKICKKKKKGKKYINSLEYECKTLANVIMSYLEDYEPPVKKGWNHFSNELEKASLILETYDKILKNFQEKAYYILVEKTLLWTYEAISSYICTFYMKGLLYCKKNSLEEEQVNLYKKLNEIQSLRKSYSWPIARSMSSLKGEKQLYRHQQLKKWSQEALYLSVDHSRLLPQFVQLLFALAAGIAMAFTLLTTALSKKWLPEGSAYWALVAIIAYSFKDRIKENLRAFFLKIMPSVISDRLFYLYDKRENQRCGAIREQVSFPKKDVLPKEYIRARLAGKSPLSRKLVQESTFLFQRNIFVFPKKLFLNHKRLAGFTDVIRLDMSPWFSRMDEDHNSLLSMEKGEVESVSVPRTYRITLILNIEYYNEKKELKHDFLRFRIIMSKDGIRRIEEVEIPYKNILISKTI